MLVITSSKIDVRCVSFNLLKSSNMSCRGDDVVGGGKVIKLWG